MSDLREASSPPGSVAAPRLQSLDAFRGLIMLMMGSAGFALGEVARRVPGGAWEFLAHQTDHTRWVGCTVWDFIQPCFMFMVGVAVPYSWARRESLGHTQAQILTHALRRAIVRVTGDRRTAPFISWAVGKPGTQRCSRSCLWREWWCCGGSAGGCTAGRSS